MANLLVALVFLLAVVAGAFTTRMPPHGPLEWAYWFLPPIMLGFGIFAARRLRRVAQQLSSIRNDSELSEFKIFAANQMRLALMILVMNGLWVIAIVSGFNTWMTLAGSSYSMLVAIVFVIMRLWVKPMERAVWSISIADSNLRQQYEHVCRVWRTRPLPDW
jgi:hypothetical protein